MVRSIGICGFTALATARLGARDRRQHEPVDGQPDQDMRRRPGEAGVAPADSAPAPIAVSGQPTVEAKPAISVMPVIERRAASPCMRPSAPKAAS